MQELAWLLEPLRVWLEGGSFAEVSATPGFNILFTLILLLVPPTIIALSLGDTDWAETPLGRYFGARQKDPGEDSMWTWKARDVDGDGTPDI